MCTLLYTTLPVKHKDPNIPTYCPSHISRYEGRVTLSFLSSSATTSRQSPSPKRLQVWMQELNADKPATGSLQASSHGCLLAEGLSTIGPSVIPASFCIARDVLLDGLKGSKCESYTPDAAASKAISCSHPTAMSKRSICRHLFICACS